MTDEANPQPRLAFKEVKTPDRIISKISMDPNARSYMMSTSGFNFIYKCASWSRQTPVPPNLANDGFVIQNAKRMATMKSVHQAIRSMIPIEKCQLKQYPTDTPFGDWRDDIVIWWNLFVSEGYEIKMPQLFLFGPSNVGKSKFIRDLLGILLTGLSIYFY